MNKKVLTIVAIVAVVILAICSVAGFLIFRGIQTANDEANKLKNATETTTSILDQIGNSLDTTTTPSSTTAPGKTVCSLLTAEDAKEILGANVKNETYDSNAESGCTYVTDDASLTNFGIIAISVVNSNNSIAAKAQLEQAISIAYGSQGEYVTINGADSAYFSSGLKQLAFVKDNYCFFISMTSSKYDDVKAGAVATAEKIIAHL